MGKSNPSTNAVNDPGNQIMTVITSTNRGARRSGFTLIELMVVIVIISILMAFLLPALSGVRRNARIAQVRTEISSLEAAITSFKQKYGVEPPSQVVLYETAAGWNADPDSRGKIRQIWPQFDFTLSRNVDLNGTAGEAPSGSSPNEVGKVTLSQGECLAFFLGGILQRPEDSDNDGILDSGEDQDSNSKLNAIVKSGSNTLRSTPTGFSKNPINPFALGGSRDTAVFEFDVARFVDTNGNGYPEFVDPLPSQKNPYLYISSYEGQGYRSNSALTTYEFATAAQASAIPYPPTGPYLQSVSGTTSTPHKAKSFQLVSPGFDGYYGPFGVWTEKTWESDLTTGNRKYEVDNITNFHSSTLGK